MTLRKRPNDIRECGSATNSRACKRARVERGAEEVTQLSSSSSASESTASTAPRFPMASCVVKFVEDARTLPYPNITPSPQVQMWGLPLAVPSPSLAFTYGAPSQSRAPLTWGKLEGDFQDVDSSPSPDVRPLYRIPASEPSEDAAAPHFHGGASPPLAVPPTPAQQSVDTRLCLPPSATNGEGESSSSPSPVVRPLYFIPASEPTTPVGKPRPQPHQPILSPPRLSIGDPLANGSSPCSPTLATASQREVVRAAPSPIRCIRSSGMARVDARTQTFASDYEKKHEQVQCDGNDNLDDNGNVATVQVIGLYGDESEEHSRTVGEAVRNAIEIVDLCTESETEDSDR
ncbi:hypothetical protein BWQ96_08997 [Gracilariopsis chorda]|uniref:Uncharacterized protein n=1 Tax=Gracilariopsis chorda TaxID=448386 RepID=A0A2V3IGX2_9FLOR|nr:hypothetical protein BWQ96_08997 [Gracilariopsis chorda]|eukprot:PXF41288.1 hypothetical protein BWQ96_08997 [Gracilariopsis chorda]